MTALPAIKPGGVDGMKLASPETDVAPGSTSQQQAVIVKLAPLRDEVLDGASIRRCQAYVCRTCLRGGRQSRVSVSLELS